MSSRRYSVTVPSRTDGTASSARSREALPMVRANAVVVWCVVVAVGVGLRKPLWVSAAAAGAGFYCAALCWRRQGGASPGVFYGISAGTMFGLANVAYLLALNSSFEALFLNYGVADYYYEASLVGLLGTVLPLVTYMLVSRLCARSSYGSFRLGATMSRRGARRFGWSLLAAALLARAMPGLSEALGSLGIVLDLGPSLAIFVLRMESLEGRKDSAGRSLILLAVTVGEVLYHLAFSLLRTLMIWPCVAYVCPMFIGTRRFRNSSLHRYVLVVGCVVAFVVVFSQFGEVRNEFKGTERVAVVLGWADPNGEGPEAVSLTSRGMEVLARLSTLNQLSAIEGVIARDGHLEGETLRPLLYAPIPRLVWPSKPLIVPGQEFARRLGRGSERLDGTFTNAINTTLPGEFRLNFGWIGAAGGSVFLGGLMAVAWSACRHYSQERDPPSSVAAFLLLTNAAFVGSNAAVLFNLVSAIAVTTVIAASIRVVRRRPERHGPQGGVPTRFADSAAQSRLP